MSSLLTVGRAEPFSPTTASYALIRHDLSASFARREGRSITAAQFLRDVAALAAQLPDARQLVNLCRDRYRFAVAFAASLCRQCVTLLPPSDALAALARIAADYPGCWAIDDGGLHSEAIPVFAYPSELRHDTAPPLVPVIPANQIAAVLFTSGSTGVPQPHPRSWGALVRSTRAAAARLGLDRTGRGSVLGTVPHQHSYGLESVILLAWQNGLELQAGWPFYPDDVRRQLDASPSPRLLITTPVHLRVLVAQQVELPPLAMILSATAPLATELARAAEQRFSAPVHEIYGCSEAGQLAARRTVAGPVWEALDGILLAQDIDGVTSVSGPAAAAETRLGDAIDLLDDRRFVLHGRLADMVNIAGKRSSLAYLNHQLAAIEGVEDGVFVQPRGEGASGEGAVARLTAFVVAPRLTADEVLAALRQRIDPAFLPRPLHLVERLPRNALGKVTREGVQGLADETGKRASCGIARRTLPRDHPTAAGHFPGNPIIPGALLLDEILDAVSVSVGFRPRLAVRMAKFLAPVRPGDTLAISWVEQGPDRIGFECRAGEKLRVAVTGTLTCSTDPS